MFAVLIDAPLVGCNQTALLGSLLIFVA